MVGTLSPLRKVCSLVLLLSRTMFRLTTVRGCRVVLTSSVVLLTCLLEGIDVGIQSWTEVIPLQSNGVALYRVLPATLMIMGLGWFEWVTQNVPVTVFGTLLACPIR